MAPAAGTMTLVIGFGALRRLADPAAAVADAENWSAALGVTAEDGTELRTFLDRNGVDPGFVAGGERLVNALVTVRQRVTTDRHVFVGATPEERSIAENVGWEYLPVEDAAERAGWAITNGGDGTGDGADADINVDGDSEG